MEGYPISATRERRTGLNRIVRSDWLKLSVELNCLPNQNTEFSFHYICLDYVFLNIKNYLTFGLIQSKETIFHQLNSAKRVIFGFKKRVYFIEMLMNKLISWVCNKKQIETKFCNKKQLNSIEFTFCLIQKWLNLLDLVGEKLSFWSYESKC